ncbi:hypothetical protein [Sphingobium yanoikuyae]|uniref:hypothetical protein n=1 Tax=Sphingobium yanoikuyae TaxID=13690 RepID=UPI0028B05488|nr:hypothetical protein [Sphingobium yanoikuyae]
MASSSVLRLGGAPLPGLGYPPLLGSSIPVVTGLVGAHFFNSGKAVALKNSAGADGSFSGAPIEHDGNMTLNSSSYIESQIAETAALDIFAIARRPATSSGQVTILGTFLANADAGANIYNSGSSNWTGSVAKVGGVNVTVTSGTAVGTIWRLLELSAPATGAPTMRDHTAGTSGTSTDTTARSPSSRKYKFGRLSSNNVSADLDIALIVIFNRVLDDGERDLMIAWARAFAAEIGVTV